MYLIKANEIAIKTNISNKKATDCFPRAVMRPVIKSNDGGKVVVVGVISKQSSGQLRKSSPSSHTSLPHTSSDGKVVVVVTSPDGTVVVVEGQSLGHICVFSHFSHIPFITQDFILPMFIPAGTSGPTGPIS